MLPRDIGVYVVLRGEEGSGPALIFFDGGGDHEVSKLRCSSIAW